MKNLKLATKIYLVLGLALLAGTGATGYLYYRLSATTETFKSILSQEVYQQTQARLMQVTFKKEVQEWKNLLLRGFDTAAYKKHSEAFFAEEAAVKKLGEDLKATIKDPEALDALNTFEREYEPLALAYREALKVFTEAQGKNSAEADKMVAGKDRAPTAQIDAIVDRLDKKVQELTRVEEENSAAAQRSVAVSALLLFGAVVAVSIFMIRSITAPMRHIAEAADKIASGDVEQNVSYQSNDEVGKLAEAFRGLISFIQATAGAAHALSVGDLTVKVQPRSEKDRLSKNFNQVVETLQQLVQEAGQLNTAARDGHLDERSDPGKFRGVYAQLVAGMNETLVAVQAPIAEAAQVLAKLAERDLRVKMEGDYRGEYLKIKDAMNTAAVNLDRALTRVAVGSEQVSSAASQISAGSMSLSQGASEQASSLEEVASSMQEMASMTRQNAANSKEARSLTEGARGMAERGLDSMKRLSEAIDKIKSSSDATAKIVKTIDEIAFQTNLLALNAAVEAARAGDAGKGFAVVAEEVRNLAMRCAEAAKNTSGMIEDSVRNAEGGVAINQEVLKNLTEINVQVNRVSEVMSEISAASDQQSNGVEQVNNAVQQMNQVTQQVAANAEESASAAEELTGQAEEMKGMVNEFKLSSQRSAARPGESRPSAPAPAAQKSPAGRPARAGNGRTATKPQDLIPFAGETPSTVLSEF